MNTFIGSDVMLNREPIQEMINGEIYLLAPSAHPNHGMVVDSLIEQFRKIARLQGCSAHSDNIDMYFNNENYVTPDFSIICDKENITSKGYNGVPKLIVEVLSPSTATKDRTVKKDLYEKIGIPEYWIIDYRWKNIEKYILVDGKYILNSTMYSSKNDDIEIEGDPLIWCEHLPDHKINIDSLFEDCF